MFHDGTPPYSTPLQIAFLAEQFPHVPVILGHSGLLDLYHDAALAARANKNIWLQPGGASYRDPESIECGRQGTDAFRQ